MKEFRNISYRYYKSVLFLLLILGSSCLFAQLPAERFKRVDYEYDLISGKVNEVKYQEDQSDQFYHKYEYDADNRITHVQTSNNKVLWDMDAKYFYYAHGPLARTEIGDSKVQGMDNVYTLQGWIKGVNSNILDPKNDVGKDALQVSGNTNRDFAKDACSYSLGYYETDYSPIENVSWANVTDRFVAETPIGSNLMQSRNNLYDGNVSSMVTTIESPGKYKPRLQGTSYHYDQVDRILEMQAYQNVDVAANTWQSGAVYQGSYNNTFSYDESGNILKQLRKDGSGATIDSLSYRYEREAVNLDLKRNRLLSVKDIVSNGNYGDDIDDQALVNYTYDEIGNLKSDALEETDSIKWNIYQKVMAIIHKVGSARNNLRFDYDASGNRISKRVYTSNNAWLYTEYYVRDAEGHVLSIYRHEIDKDAVSFAQTEKHIYGSALLGIENTKTELIGWAMDEFNYNGKYPKRYLAHKNYQENNHLGNVLTVVTDKKIPVSSNGTTIDYYLPDILSSNDYYPFGAPMAKRTFSAPAYRFGFNGQEKTDEVSGAGNHNTALYGELDTRLARRWNPDPKPNVSLSFYSVFSNSPIWQTDALLDTPTVKEAAFIADHVYGPDDKGHSPDLINNWEQVDLKIPGVVYDDKVGGSGYNAALYRRTVNGKTDYVFATRGSEMKLNDWKNNLQQPFGCSDQYKINAANAQALQNYFGDNTDLTFVGHSLGGGLAAEGAMVSNHPAITFNAAGLSPITKAQISTSFANFAKNMASPLFRKIDAYVVSGEIVNSISPSGLGADGNVHSIDVSWFSGYKYDPTGISKHMMGAVKNALDNEGIK